MKNSEEVKEKICSSCGKSVTLSAFFLHSTQCSKNKEENKFDSSNYLKNLNSNPFMIVNNQINPSDQPSSDFRLINSNSGLKVPTLGDNHNNIDLFNSFMQKNKKEILQNKDQNDRQTDSENHINLNSDFKIVDNRSIMENSNNRISHLHKNDDKICPICFKSFANNTYFDLHVRNCVDEEESQKWEVFENRNMNNRSNYYENEYDIVNDPNYEHRARSISSHSDDEIDFNNPDLEYEDLLRLDENITHPLSKTYLSMLPDEKITFEIMSKLNEETKQCMICFENFQIDQKFIRLPCIHIFHSEEIVHWFGSNKTCPICRLDIENFFKGQ